jgi:pimeloyl-ACP methyl ester carboxylesterase
MGGEISVMYAMQQSLNAEDAGPRVGSVVAQGLYTPWQRDVAWRFSGPTLFLYLTDPIPPLFVSPPVVLSNWMFPPRHIYATEELRRDFRTDSLRKRAFPGRVVVKAARYRLQKPPVPIETPLLLLHGTRDRVVRVRYAERVYEGLTRYFATIELAEIPGASHGLFEEETMAASVLIDDWLLRTLP